MPSNKKSNKQRAKSKNGASRGTKKRSVRNNSNQNRGSKSSAVTFAQMRPVRARSGLKFGSGSASSGSELCISGVEFFTDVTTSTNTGYTLTLQINPSNVSMFPKLQGVALLFEEFYVRSLTVKYITACPSTRSGSIAMCFDYDAGDAAPASTLAMMANSSAVIGSVAENLSVHFIQDSQRSRWFYTNIPYSNSLTTFDQRQIIPANLHIIISNSTSADAGLVAGYFEVAYQFEFKIMRPPAEVYAVSSSPLVGTTAGLGLDVDIPLLLEGAIGYTGNTGSLVPRSKNSSSYTGANSLLLQAGAYVVSYLWNLLAVGSFVKTDEKGVSASYVDQKSKTVSKVFDTPTYVNIRQNPDGSWSGELPDGTWVVIPPEPPSSERKTRPLTTGDYNVHLYAVDVATSVATALDNPSGTSTGAVAYSKALGVAITKPTLLVVHSTLAEARTLSNFDLSFASSVSVE